MSDFTPDTNIVRTRYATYGGGGRIPDEGRPEFDRWLQKVQTVARQEGHRIGYETARYDMVSGAFVGGPTYEALRESFTGQKIYEEGYRDGIADGEGTYDE